VLPVEWQPITTSVCGVGDGLLNSFMMAKPASATFRFSISSV